MQRQRVENNWITQFVFVSFSSSRNWCKSHSKQNNFIYLSRESSKCLKAKSTSTSLSLCPTLSLSFFVCLSFYLNSLPRTPVLSLSFCWWFFVAVYFGYQLKVQFSLMPHVLGAPSPSPPVILCSTSACFNWVCLEINIHHQLAPDYRLVCRTTNTLPSSDYIFSHLSSGFIIIMSCCFPR